MRSHVAALLLAVAALALCTGVAAAQLCPQPTTGGTRLQSTNVATRPVVAFGTGASLLPLRLALPSFRMLPAVSTSGVAAKRVAR